MAVNLEDIRVQIIRGLSAYTGVTVIRDDQGGEKPPYPYLSVGCKIAGGQGEVKFVWREVVDSAEPEWDNDIKYTYKSSPKVVISTTGYDKTTGSDIDRIVQLAWDWFDIPQLGARTLEPLEAVIRSREQIETRDTQLDFEYERRQGFDVILRATNTQTFIEKTIETIQLNGKDLDI